MPEQELNPAATKFISSLVRSLQILCNGQVEFNESIELVGHINVKIDHIYKFDYIVDEQVSKEGEDSSTTFLSNSYHSCRPTKQTHKKANPAELEQDVIFSEIPTDSQRRLKQMKNMHELEKQPESTELQRENSHQNYSVSVDKHCNEPNQMVVKLEGGEDSNDCMVLPASPVDYEGEANRTESYSVPGPSSSFDESNGNQAILTRKRRKAVNQNMVAESNNLYMSVEKIQNSSSNSRKEMSTNDNIEAQNKTQVTISLHPSFISQSTPCEGLSSENLMEKDLSYSLPSQSTPNKSVTKNEIPIDNNVSEPNVPLTSSNCSHPVHDLKQLVIKLAALCDLPSIQDEFMPCPSRYIMGPTEDDIRQAKKKFLEVVDKEKLKKIKEVLKMKKSKQKKQRLKALLIESGFSNEQLLLLAQDANIKKKRISWKSVPDGQQGKELLLKEHRKALRVKTQERHQKLLEMAEMLKRNQVNDPGITVVSKNGGKKCILHKSFVSVVSHNTQQLSLENIDEVAETLSGKSRKATLVQQSCQDKSKEQMKVEYTRRVCVKKKMKQIVAKMLAEISDAGYRVVVTSTIGSEVGSHSAELTVIPLKVDDFWPETKQSDVKPELTEDEYAKQLEREQILEKQKANEEKMKEMEIKLVRILTGAEEMFVPARKRYNPGEARPTDAERMKEYRKKLKQDPEKYQVYRQKRVMNKRRRRLGEYAAKVRVTNAGSAVSVIPTAPVTEEAHGSQTIGGLVSITQPVGGVSMHCSQVYDHPSSHQPTASVVNVHHGTQYVGQVAGMHPSHHQQQSITYGNEMDIVELIAATHNVQNQHFG
ncbi:uncharacterized protein LOC106060741 isoform X1 [Biomphalaria glabrata]|uniref:Uncharacterized protein LOC106060741 isoform X1 n=1 Tax=Biomphalaria glabrata TaxID=6526 RepID=A0A9U8E626_BIOGL|nr:uncharacterized protein LOC106060741 isoform X1 [Biomphalaria glabrata]XP_055899113.1 uncharacterized protein LOC106060741 isoform X1 [Biomphalaria glabrata]